MNTSTSEQQHSKQQVRNLTNYRNCFTHILIWKDTVLNNISNGNLTHLKYNCTELLGADNKQEQCLVGNANGDIQFMPLGFLISLPWHINNAGQRLSQTM